MKINEDSSFAENGWDFLWNKCNVVSPNTIECEMWSDLYIRLQAKMQLVALMNYIFLYLV